MTVLKRLLTRNKDVDSIMNTETSNEDASDQTDKESIDKIANDPKFLEELEKKGVDSQDKEAVYKHAAIAFCVAGGLLAFTPSASAGWVDDLAKKAAKQIQKAVEPMFKSIMNTFTGTLLEFLGGSTDKVASAIGATTDSINTVTNEIENNRIKAAVQPKPDHCKSDELGAESQKAEIRHEQRQNILAHKLNTFVFDTDPKKNIQRILEQTNKYKGDKRGRNLLIGSITTSEGLNTKEDVKQAEDVALNILGPTSSVITKDIEYAMKKNGGENAAYELQSHLAAKSARIQIAMAPFSGKIASNNNTTGSSIDKILREEINRTYGDNSKQWREEINSAADPTPVTAELCKLTALSNKIALKQLQAIEQSNMISGATLLEIIEANKQSAFSATI